jgi:hypothetical protein
VVICDPELDDSNSLVRFLLLSVWVKKSYSKLAIVIKLSCYYSLVIL